MQLRFLGKESTPTNSPTLYASDEGSYVIQGWIVTDTAVLTRLTVPANETLVEVPPGLLDYLALDGMDPSTKHPVPPIVHVTERGNFIIQGPRVTDPATLKQMDIPDHETCIHLARSTVAALVG
ncbi:hypothetical protein GCM10023321_37550 [Pseudonocardia eucalypti]|uniref:Hedgehog/Intein (Hint) domain-containing protein n=1 Tax=Pseudonocardia eucalypti TaxID=648755 RepID=A0ABP9QBQ9_9PSEU|nr:hypothetical protein [Pseudonocardia eucalypti]